MPRVFIGLPVYNGGAHIEEAILSVIDQTFQDWRLLISDNGSDDDTRRICLGFSESDSRITYRRFEMNQGACANFSMLLKLAIGDYFVWIASDDQWGHRFLEECIKLLDERDDCGMAFAAMVNVDDYDQVVRMYPDFDRFADENRIRILVRFLLEPEILGKANLIYAVYRLEIARKAWEVSPLTHNWASDISFVLAALSRTKLATDSQILFRKRLCRPEDSPGHINEIKYPRPKQHIFPLKRSMAYLNDLSRATRGTGYRPLAIIITLSRIPRAAYNEIRRFSLTSSG